MRRMPSMVSRLGVYGKTRRRRKPGTVNTGKLAGRMERYSKRFNKRYARLGGKINKVRARQTENLANLLRGKKKKKSMQGIKY